MCASYNGKWKNPHPIYLYAFDSGLGRMLISSSVRFLSPSRSSVISTSEPLARPLKRECCKVASLISSVGPESCCADTPLVLAAADPVADAGLLMVGPHLVAVVVGRWQLLAMQLPLP